MRDTTRDVQTCYGDIIFWLGKPLDLLAVSQLNNRTEEESYRVTIKLLRKEIQDKQILSITHCISIEKWVHKRDIKNKLLNMTEVSASCHMEFESESTKRLSNAVQEQRQVLIK